MISRDDGKLALQQYMKDIASSSPLSAQEEVALAARVKRGDMKARAELVEANLRFVITVARKYLGQGVPLEDLISAGNMGLITAAERFDETRGFKFISYAVWWIRQAIQQTLSEQSRMVRLPINRIGLLRKILEYVEKQKEDDAPQPSEEEIAKEVGASVEMVKETLKLSWHVASLDATFGDDNENSLLKTIADDSQEVPDALVI